MPRLAEELEAGGTRNRGHVGDEPADGALALMDSPYERRVHATSKPHSRSTKPCLADDNYYSGMAAAHLNRPMTPHPQTEPANADLLGTLQKVPALERARELILCGMRPEAMAEWQFGSESLPAEARTQSIRLAAEWGWYDQAVTVATAQHVFNDYTLLYPRPYDAEVNAAAHLAPVGPGNRLRGRKTGEPLSYRCRLERGRTRP